MNISNTKSYSYSIFDYATLQQSGMDQLSQNALSNGITYYQDGKYKEAIKEFQRSIALSPYSENTIETYDFLAAAHLQTNDLKNAEKAYKTAISMDPQREDIFLKLGNLYYSQEKYGQAEEAYRSAVNVYPSAETYYSLAHCYLAMEKLSEAENLFNKVISLEPKSGNGQYGLGMTHGKQGKFESAISLFKEALQLNPEFDDARVEMGYVLADAGKMEEAREQIEILESKDSNLSSLLYAYVYKVEKPKFVSAYQGTFNWNLSMRTSIVALDNYLKNAGETRYFSVIFKFNKDMDARSVQNPVNWKIGRAAGYGSQAYNFGLKLAANDIEIPRYPTSVIYDPSDRTAKVIFAITQNEYADGIMDPSHIEFMFSGVDRFGLKMDSEFDTFSKYNGFA